jgi:AcrR family transcriptional regulator
VTTLPKNVRIGRNGRVGILKKVPRDLWHHPHYAPHAKVIERSTGTVDLDKGVPIALAMLSALDEEFAAARADRADRIGAYAGPAGRRAGAPAGNGNGTEARPRQRTSSKVGERTRREILAAAMQEFAAKGFSGARVDAIAANTSTTKPMIYYHFGSKEKLYAAVMEEAYGGVRSTEQGLHLDALPAAEAMRRLVEATFDYHAEHPDYVRLISTENIEKGRHISGRPSLVARNAIALDTVRDVLARGERDGAFRAGISPWHLHFMISALCFMRVSNRYSMRAVFEKDLWEAGDVPLQRRMIVETILRYVAP